MSFWSKLKESVDSGISSIQSTYNDLISFPTEVQCPSQACLAITPINPTIFDWRCLNGHPNIKEASVCASCPCTRSEVKAAHLYLPRVNCIRCRRLIDVADTKVQSWTSTQLTNAPTTFHKAVDEVKSLGAQPNSFHCQHCNSELALPRGAWQCRNDQCMAQNAEHIQSCLNCQKDRFFQGVVCGICHQNTSIPAYKITDHLNRLTTSAQSVSQQGYLRFVKQEPYCLCQLCENPIVLNEYQAKYLLNELEYNKQLEKQTEGYAQTTTTTTQGYNSATSDAGYTNGYASYSTYQPPQHPKNYEPTDPYAGQPQLYPNASSIVLDDIRPYEPTPNPATQPQLQLQPQPIPDKPLDADVPPSYDHAGDDQKPTLPNGVTQNSSLYAQADPNNPHADDITQPALPQLNVACAKCHKINQITFKNLVQAPTKDDKSDKKDKKDNKDKKDVQSQPPTTTTTTTATTITTTPSLPTNTASTAPAQTQNSTSPSNSRYKGTMVEDEEQTQSLLGDIYSAYPSAPPPDYS